VCIGNGLGTGIGAMDSVAMLSATQHGWLSGKSGTLRVQE
jgi:hypothetical protein